MSSPSTYDKVKAVFDKYGVPEYVWYPIAFAESGLNPNAVGDNGASIGLFQINRVGGQGIGYTADQLRDPVFNAEVAVRAIAPAYNAVKGSYQGADVAAEVARRSGHPGGSVASPFNVNDSRIQRIKSLAQKFIGGYMENRYIAGGGESSKVLGDLAPGSVEPDVNVIPGLAALQPIGDAVKSLSGVFEQMGAPGFLLGVIGVMLVVISLGTLLNEQKGKVVQAVTGG